MPQTKSVLPDNFGGGPHGYGDMNFCALTCGHPRPLPVLGSVYQADWDPEDKTLRKVEVEVVIPKLMREKARAEKCTKEVEEFGKCCKDSSLLMVVTCRKQNAVLRECLTSWYQDESFRKLCTEEYLKERAEFRSTGNKKSTRRA